MDLNVIKRTAVKAVAAEVLPKTGLAYFVDDDQRTWAVTRQKAGITFDELHPGSCCTLTLRHYSDFILVDGCEFHRQAM